MATLTISVESRDATIARVVSAANNGIATQTERIVFETPEQLFKALTLMRWQIMREMMGAGPLSIRELAQRLHGEQDQVHEDVRALLNVGVLDHAEDGAVVFPYDVVHVDFMIDLQHPEQRDNNDASSNL